MYINSFVLVIFILLLLILIFVPIIIFSIISKDLKSISNKILKMSQGDLTQKIHVSDKSIFKGLSKNINLLILKIRELINESTNMTDKLIDYCKNLEEDAIKVKISSTENSRVVDVVAAKTSEQLEDTSVVESLIKEIAIDHENVLNNAQEIKSLSSSMMNLVQNGNEFYSQLTSKLTESSDSNLRLADKITSLNERAYKIQEIADAVSDISKNTNLLSLNASIEAARSREGGNGFTVVANEIRKLANISSEQALEIQNIINEIKNEILDISNWMNSEVEIINKNIEFSNVIKDSLSNISDQSENTLESVKNINEIISSQDYKINKIENLIKETCLLSEHTVNESKQLKIESKLQVDAMKSTLSSIKNLTEMNKGLRESVASFAKNYEITSDTKSYIENGIRTLRELAKNPILSLMDYHKCTKTLNESIKNHPEFDLFAIMQKDGLRKAITLDYTENQVYVNFAHRQYFKESISGREYQSQPYISDDTYNYCIALTVPVRDQKGAIVGILIGDLILG
ncbi:methyl-accepting chemotaxis protein [Clostridium cylindrosporum]|uniref:Methyl-accepting chemotaxis protein n=1 Tax=Clostridium cylindrosporum DSM 605 TaxID=1121307 RepID=A0A0J8D9J4_CLOCY|nr:methyl-accepting chemotaxis protein [Clostridium cylindrosporum]KMT20994.1 methyl-accepting chemotaxis protein [Clostridium cylindrosporum DSM 605]